MAPSCVLRLVAAALAVSAVCAPASFALDSSHAKARLGVYRGPGSTGAARVAEFERFIGRPVFRVLDFVGAENWASVEAPYYWFDLSWTKPGSPFATNGGERLTMGFAMLPEDNAGGATNPGPTGPATLEEGAAGTYDSHWARLATWLANRGLTRLTLRLGNEFNGNWTRWRVDDHPSKPAWFAAYWRRIVTAMREAVPENDWKFEYTVSYGDSGTHVDPSGAAYPGDAYVDYIGVNVYDNYYGSPAGSGTPPDQRWQHYLTQTPETDGPGLRWMSDFARRRNKPLVIGEWGAGWQREYSGGDAPYFIDRMVDFIENPINNVAYHNWWDGGPTWSAQLDDGLPGMRAAFAARLAGSSSTPSQPEGGGGRPARPPEGSKANDGLRDDRPPERKVRRALVSDLRLHLGRRAKLTMRTLAPGIRVSARVTAGKSRRSLARGSRTAPRVGRHAVTLRPSSRASARRMGRSTRLVVRLRIEHRGTATSLVARIRPARRR